MPIAMHNIDYTFSTLAIQNDFISKIHSGITSCGWVQTSDTGQIGSLTALSPTAVGNIAGFRTYVNSDASFYIRVSFGSGLNVSSASSVRIIIGTGTNGAGLITGNGSSKVFSLQFTGGATAVTRFYGDGQDLAIAFQTGNASNRCGVFTIGASRNSSSARDGKYVHVLFEGDNGLSESRGEAVIYAFGQGGEDPAGSALYQDPLVAIKIGVPSVSTASLGQKNMAGINGFTLSPYFPQIGCAGYPTGIVLHGYKIDAGAGSTLNLNVYGINSKYICIGETSSVYAYGQNNNVRALWIKWNV